MKFGNAPHVAKKISRLVIGSVGFLPEKQDYVNEMLDAFISGGGNCIDFSHIYYGGKCQAAVGTYMKERGNRDQLVLFDKGCHHGSQRRVTREAIVSDILDNHRNLQVSKAEFYTLHRDDQLVSIEKVVDWLNEQVQAGRIEAFGGSNMLHSRIKEGNEYAQKNGLQGFSASSPNISLASPNAPMWAECLSLDEVAREWYSENQFPVFSWSSGGGGFFAGIESPDIIRVYHNRINFERLKRAKEFANKLNTSPSSIALAWTLNQPLNIFALVGPANVSQLKENLEAVEITFDPDQLRYLEKGN